ncbi:MAG: radical SAM protein [Candidatus Accumulibacter sp.]|jgi:hypothetical protein|nr:radical SAM protein [Accumulibacter sp.]
MSFARSSLNFAEVAAKYPDFPRFVMLKTDIHRRGLSYTDAALAAFDPERHQAGGTHLFNTRDGKLTGRPESISLRDGTLVLATPAPPEQNPYVVDVVDGKLTLTDRGEAIDEVFYWDKPDYYGKRTSNGVLMQNVVSSRPQRLFVVPNRFCHFWTDGGRCKFCDIVNNLKQQRAEIAMQTKIKAQDIKETIQEALKEKGRFTAVFLTGGSDFRGEEAFDRETDYYIDILRTIDECFAAPKYPSQLLCTALNKEQLQRIHEQTGLTSVTMDIEVLDEEQFNRVCPGKARWIGYREWKRRLCDAVEVFGENRVNTGIVSGTEIVAPTRFRSEDEALEAVLSEADDLAAHGVSTVNMVWQPRPESDFGKEQNASLEYYVRLAWGLQNIRRKHGLRVDFDDYRRCGNHPDSDLARVF